MRLPAQLGLVVATLTLWSSAACADNVDVVVQAGHQGRPASCAPMHVRACNLGASSGDVLERDWTPVVADAAAAALRSRGFTVLRRPADWEGSDSARAAVFIHFDGATPCASGASVGFPDGTNRAFVDA